MSSSSNIYLPWPVCKPGSVTSRHHMNTLNLRTVSAFALIPPWSPPPIGKSQSFIDCNIGRHLLLRSWSRNGKTIFYNPIVQESSLTATIRVTVVTTVCQSWTPVSSLGTKHLEVSVVLAFVKLLNFLEYWKLNINTMLSIYFIFRMGGRQCKERKKGWLLLQL